MNGKKQRHRACIACNQRKVRCNGEQRCQQCEHLNLPCEYAAPVGRQARQTAVTKILKRPGHDVTPRNIVAAPQVGSAISDDRDLRTYKGSLGIEVYEESSFYLEVLPDFQTFVLPFHPVITIPEAEHAIATMSQDSEARAFVYGLVAVTLNLTNSLRSHPTPGKASSDDETSSIATWVSRCLKALTPVLIQEEISVRRIATLQFVHVCLMGLGRHEVAFYYLRQSTTLVEILRINDAEIMASLPLSERARRQRLYWLISIHERFYAITCQRPIVLPALSTMPEPDTAIPSSIGKGFEQIVRLFLHIDEDMLAKWFATFDNQQIIEPAWITEKHRQIDNETAGSADEVGSLSTIQQADLVITKHWLRMLVWQMAMSKCLLSSESSEQSMSLLFPVGVSGQLRALLAGMSRYDIEVHGSGIQQKLFELTDTIASVVLTVPAASLGEKRQRLDDFSFLFEFWKSLPRPNPVQTELLESKYLRLAEIGLDYENELQAEAQ